MFSRQHARYPTNFTVGVIYRTAGHTYRLLRANGLHPGGHVNHLEGTSFGTSFHVHRASERYQQAGFDIDGYAEQSDEFTSFEQAFSFVERVASLRAPSGDESRLL